MNRAHIMKFDGFNILNHLEFLPPVGIDSPHFGFDLDYPQAILIRLP